MATIQGYTKTGVDKKMASRSNVTFTYSGTGTPELKAFPDAKTGDVIERTSDRAQWRVLGNTVAPLGFIVTKVNGLTGEVNLTAAELNASPTGHKHTIADITDLTVSKTVTPDHVVQRTTSGDITVPTTPNATTSAASKAYVDSKVSTTVDSSHTHVKSDITDLEVISTTVTANHIVKRNTDGGITVPTTPSGDDSATSKSYVDAEVVKKANTSHTHGISDVSGLQEALNSAGSSVHTHVSTVITDSVYGDVTTSSNRLVKTDLNGYLRAPAVPTENEHAASKGYVDAEMGKKANTSHTHIKSQITDLEVISTTATADHLVKRITSGNITVPTTPNATTSATSKSYVDSEVNKKADTSHTHVKANITDLEVVSTGASGNHIVKRNTDGNITVPTTPAATTSATSKSYVDTEVGKKANASHTHTKENITDLEPISSSLLSGHVPIRTESGNLIVPTTPNGSTAAASKQYVDNTVPWTGTRTQYNAITTKDANRLYIIKGA